EWVPHGRTAGSATSRRSGKDTSRDGGRTNAGPAWKGCQGGTGASVRAPPVQWRKAVEHEQGQEGVEELALAGAELPGGQGEAGQRESRQVQDGDGGPGRESQFEQLVMEVVAPRRERGTAAQGTGDQQEDR